DQYGDDLYTQIEFEVSGFQDTPDPIAQGGVTIGGDQTITLGETAILEGTNTVSETTYLFIVGPNLNPKGMQIGLNDPQTHPVIDANSTTFQAVKVQPNGSWSWNWNTTGTTLDPSAQYTIYAVSQPHDRAHLHSVPYAKTSTGVKKAFVAATLSSATVAPDETLSIRGYASGTQKLLLWLFNAAEGPWRSEVVVSPDSPFTFEIPPSRFAALPEGDYFLLIQHPGRNMKFDIDLDPNDSSLVRGFPSSPDGNPPGQRLFRISGPGCLKSEEAVQALGQAINNPTISDDTYTRLQFSVKRPKDR
ncbi:MAG: hypothetical protein LUP97_08485, partial [Methanoregula sp.]|nr:hypothetical protein [Methanoregula sp.]